MDKNPVKILFFSYTFPPRIIGGIETYMYELTSHFKEIHPETYTLVNRRGLAFLPVFIPYSIFKAIRLIRKHNITHLHSASGPHCFEALLIRKLTGVKLSITIHGLDIIIKLFMLDRILPFFVKRFDKIFCVSNATRRECIARGVPAEKCAVIFNGVNPDTFPLKLTRKEMQAELEHTAGISLKGKKVLCTNGRLIKRKGVAWFILNVMPKLEERYIYLVSGDGPERDEIKAAIAGGGLESRVRMLGKTGFRTLRLLYNAADMFIMPNIQDPGTMEGFGLVILEAGSCGTPVIASKIEGISDAVIHGVTGWLVPEKDVNGFIKRIHDFSLPRAKIIATIKKRFDWASIAAQYLKDIRGIHAR